MWLKRELMVWMLSFDKGRRKKPESGVCIYVRVVVV